MADTFTCDGCGGTFPKAWTDEEAEAEAREVWGAMPEDASVICDDCFHGFMPWVVENHPEALISRWLGL
jgi:hypothetical protein